MLQPVVERNRVSLFSFNLFNNVQHIEWPISIWHGTYCSTFVELVRAATIIVEQIYKCWTVCHWLYQQHGQATRTHNLQCNLVFTPIIHVHVAKLCLKKRENINNFTLDQTTIITMNLLKICNQLTNHQSSPRLSFLKQHWLQQEYY